tara:strand:+ start:4543 stop:5088 length:546 start_codon:yes stop_codon:yes gene_type:complete
MDHTEAIVDIHGIVGEPFIKRMIPFIKHKAKKPMEISNRLDKNVRNVSGYNLKTITPTDIFYFNFIKKEIERLYYYYKIKFPLLRTKKVDQIDLLKYKSGGKYTTHTDSNSITHRHISVIMNLNEDYEGGELLFTDQKNNDLKKIHLKKGSIVFFPSNFLYPHGILPILKGTRYSIVAWLH